jgi:hypothetical protein
MTNKLKNIILTYLLVFVIGTLANIEINGFSLDFLWIVYLPIATHISIIMFDLLSDYINFDLLRSFKQENQAIYTISLSILSAGFAIATAIFLK